MKYPLPEDYINIHTHGSIVSTTIFAIENLMAHEDRAPCDIPEQPCTYGIHPWHLNRETLDRLIFNVHSVASSPNLVAIGEAGFDKLRGPDLETQTRAFDAQVIMSEEIRKPLFIHCVRAWDELLPAHKRLRPKMQWMIHGFRGNEELAKQLLSKGMYLSFWFNFVMRPESAKLLRSLPKDRIFLETDGADVDISKIYNKVSIDLNMSVDDLKKVFLGNYKELFTSICPTTPLKA